MLSAPWNSFLSPVLLIKYAAFFAWVNISLHSTTPKVSSRCSSLHVSFLKRVHLRHSNRTCRTVCDLWPLSANFRLYRKARRLIFPVLICVISALSGFLTLCSCKTLVLGLGANARSSLTLPPSLCTVLIAALRGTVPRT